MVFRKELDEKGAYLGQDGKRYSILHCERTESKEWYDTGDVNPEGGPIYATRVAINVGWVLFDSEEAAAAAYGLRYQPLEALL